MRALEPDSFISRNSFFFDFSSGDMYLISVTAEDDLFILLVAIVMVFDRFICAEWT